MVTPEVRIAWEQFKSDVADGIIKPGLKVRLIEGHIGYYEGFNNIYGETCTIHKVTRNPTPDDTALELKTPPLDGTCRIISIVFSEIEYSKEYNSPLTNHLRNLINVE